MTLEKIRAALPTHIMLTPGVHKGKKGDLVQFRDHFIARESDLNRIIDGFDAPQWRPIPPHILDNQAFWLWRGQFGKEVPLAEDFSFAEFDAHTQAGRLYDKWLLEQMEDV